MAPVCPRRCACRWGVTPRRPAASCKRRRSRGYTRCNTKRIRMQLFSDPLHNEFAVGALAYTRYGGLTAGELAALGQAVGDGNDDAFYTAFLGAGDRFVAAAEAKERSAHSASAGALLLRAAIHYGLSFKPIYGTPVDP